VPLDLAGVGLVTAGDLGVEEHAAKSDTSNRLAASFMSSRVRVDWNNGCVAFKGARRAGLVEENTPYFRPKPRLPTNKDKKARVSLACRTTPTSAETDR
jgi:hypothetical protein